MVFHSLFWNLNGMKNGSNEDLEGRNGLFIVMNRRLIMMPQSGVVFYALVIYFLTGK